MPFWRPRGLRLCGRSTPILWTKGILPFEDAQRRRLRCRFGGRAGYACAAVQRPSCGPRASSPSRTPFWRPRGLRLCGRSTPILWTKGILPFEDALGERDDQHFARGLLQDVIHRRGEEAGLAPPARRRAENDQVGPLILGLLDDRLPDRAGADRSPLDVYAVVGAEELRLGERGVGTLLVVVKLGVDREVHRHPD